MNKKVDVVRAWRDEEYRDSLTEEERANLPENPAGLADVSDSVLRSVAGGCGTYKYSDACMTIFDGCSTLRSDSCVQPGENCP